MEKIEKDFNKFSPQDYLKEYYTDIGFENENLLNFFHKVYSKLEMKDKVLEFGGGPTVYQLISARNIAKDIVFSDYNEGNLDEVRSWISGEDSSFDWDRWFEYVLKKEGKDVDPDKVSEAKQQLRSKINNLIKCDGLDNNPLDNEDYKKYFDLISVNFVPESATDNEDDYLLFVKNILSLLKPHGTLIMTLLQGAKYYHVGKEKFPAFPIKDEDHIKSVLGGFGFSSVDSMKIGAEDNQGYEGMIFLVANR